jgi:phospho-N-acetylmuramoyl-pentapeptide-transferase
MLYYLIVRLLLPWLDVHRQGPSWMGPDTADRLHGALNVFRYVTFRATCAVAMSFVLCLLIAPPVIRWLRARKIGDLATFDSADMDKKMEGKKGTPTMGGIIILTSIALSVLTWADLGNFYVQMALLCMFWLGAVGAVDDWLKLTAARRETGRQGLTSLEKLLFQIGLGVLLSYFTFYYGQNSPHNFYFPFFKNWVIELGIVPFILIGTLVLTGASNAVNLTDGLDGLAAGTMAIVSFAFCILSAIVGTWLWADYLFLPWVQAADEMSIIAAAMTGACLGFLWFNCNPASVFMGDTGSLALGGLIGYIALVTRQELMLFMIGGIFVIEAFSVMLQVSYFKYTRHRFGEGRRIFLMSPLHHHFQKKGWSETQVVVRFWLIAAMLAAMALATIKLR